MKMLTCKESNLNLCSFCTLLCSLSDSEALLKIKRTVQAVATLLLVNIYFENDYQSYFVDFTSEKRRKKKIYPWASSVEGRDYVTLNIFCGRGEWKE